MELKQKPRRIQHIGKSYYVALPQCWVETMNMKKGDVLQCMIKDNGEVVISR